MVRQNQHGKFAKACANKKAHNAYAASVGTMDGVKPGTSGIEPHHRRKTYYTTRKSTSVRPRPGWQSGKTDKSRVAARL